jgi:hypothetical protein
MEADALGLEISEHAQGIEGGSKHPIELCGDHCVTGLQLSPAQIEDAPCNSRPRLLHQSIKFFRNQFDQVDPALLRHEAARPVERRINTPPSIDGLAARHSRHPADHPQWETLTQQL